MTASPKLVSVPMIGRFGNQMCQYAYARAYAEQNGLTLTTHNWIGRKIFNLNDPISDPSNERTHYPWSVNLPLEYRTHQKDMIYSKADAQRWFQFRPEVEALLKSVPVPEIAAHQRVGDYIGQGYVIVSKDSYLQAAIEFGYDPEKVSFVTEEQPFKVDGLPPFLPDFYRCMMAPVLFRGNSTFSWWAGVLSNGRVFSPVIEGKAIGNEPQRCKFVEGNHPKIVDREFVTDLHLKP